MAASSSPAMSTGTLNVDGVGAVSEPFTVAWTATDAVLYALGVGAGQADPLAELAWTTENSAGVTQRVLPTFGVPLVQSKLLSRLPVGRFDRTRLVHADQSLDLHAPIPPTGTATVQARLEGIEYKRSGAIITVSARASEPDDGEPLWTTRLAYFARGAKGVGGRILTPVADDWEQPPGEPDLVISTPTRPDQALLYRLSGDRNPLHCDPAFAARAGFDRPILHGLCTYGVVHRGLLSRVCDGDDERVRSMYARFSAPVLPGTELRTSVWRERQESLFQTVDDTGRVVLDRGRFTHR